MAAQPPTDSHLDALRSAGGGPWWQRMMELASDAILINNPSGTIVDVNSRLCALVGYTRDELIGTSGHKLIDPDDLKRQPIVIPQRDEGPVMFERVYRRKDGSRVRLEYSTTLLDDGLAMYIGRDITERKASELAVAEREREYRLLMENAYDGILIVNSRNEIVHANRSACTMLGYTLDEMVGRPFPSLIEPENLRSDPPQHDDVLAGRSVIKERRLVRKDGAVLHLEMSAARIAADRTQAILRDITQRKQAESDLLEREAALQEAQAIANLGHWSWDPNTDAFYLSEELGRILGLPATDPGVGMADMQALFHPDDREAAVAQFEADVAAHRDRTDSELRIIRPDGVVRHIYSRGRILWNAEGRIERLFGTTLDITERKELERQLSQAAKMDALGKLTGGIAHDFNNLLTVVLGNLYMMEKEGRYSAPSVTAAIGAAERGEHLVRQLLSFGRRQLVKTESVNVNGQIRELMQLLRRTLGEDIQVELDLSDAVGSASTDRTQLETALINLAINARDAMPDGGTLRIATSMATSMATASTHAPEGAALQPVRYIRIAVSDNGPGMTSEVIQQAFDPFFTTKDVGKGSGLGLSMVYGFAQQSGGHVEIESHPGRGTTVLLYLRSVDAADTVPAADSPPPESLPARQATILLVEDDRQVREVTAQILESLGYQVVSAVHGADALKRLEAGNGTFDLVVTDMVMPGGIGGTEVARLAQERHPEIRVLLTTGYADKLEVLEGQPIPWPVLRKPYAIAELEREVAELLNEAARPA